MNEADPFGTKAKMQHTPPKGRPSPMNVKQPKQLGMNKNINAPGYGQPDQQDYGNY